MFGGICLKKITLILICCVLVFSISLSGCNKTDTGNITASPTGTVQPAESASLSPSPTPITGPRVIYPVDQQRFINFWMANFNGNNLPNYLLYVDKYLTQFNANCVDIWANWYTIEKKQGEYNFSKYDQLIEKVASVGAKVYMRINTMDMPEWLYSQKDDQGRCIYTQYDYNGQDIINGSATGGVRAGILSYANEEARKYALLRVTVFRSAARSRCRIPGNCRDRR